jgi:hypothetical protein
MAWYLNHYHCGDCGTDWDDEWSCCCDDECPACGSGDWSPTQSEDLTEIVLAEADGAFVVCRSPDSAEDRPDYLILARFSTEALAMRFVNDGDLT